MHTAEYYKGVVARLEKIVNAGGEFEEIQKKLLAELKTTAAELKAAEQKAAEQAGQSPSK